MFRVIAASILLTLLFCVGGFAQSTGTITGTVLDESGAVIPNGNVTITNKATSFARTVTTNAEGYFSAVALPAGDYDVKAEVAGFRTLVRPATVQAGETTQVNLPMSLGQTQEVVTVEAASAQINYESHNIQGVIQRSTIQDLPLNGRSYLQLAALEPDCGHNRRRQYLGQHRRGRRDVLDELLARDGAGVSDFGGQLRYLNPDRGRRRHQCRDALRQQ
jgi:uncharacterized membrane protein